ncbi:hypothetical protein LZG72_04100 [Dyadobacter sp. CY323]|nr:hypothetical protein [Dyadobacter sp. CY323]
MGTHLEYDKINCSKI